MLEVEFDSMDTCSCTISVTKFDIICSHDPHKNGAMILPLIRITGLIDEPLKQVPKTCHIPILDSILFIENIYIYPKNDKHQIQLTLKQYSSG